MHFSSAFKPFVHLMCVYHKVDTYLFVQCYVCTCKLTANADTHTHTHAHTHTHTRFHSCTHVNLCIQKSTINASVAVVHWTAVFSERDSLSLCHFKKQSVWESPMWQKHTAFSTKPCCLCAFLVLWTTSATSPLPFRLRWFLVHL